MTTNAKPAVGLICFPNTKCDAVARLRACAQRSSEGLLRLNFVLEGNLAHLHLPLAAPAHRGHELWRRTCFEAFVARDGDPAYHELNVSPDGAWDLHAFRGYRDGGPLGAGAPAPSLTFARTADRLELTASLDLARLAPGLDADPLRVGLAAVIEDDAGALTYWALLHPGARPDFHLAAGFVLRIEARGR